MGGDVYIEQLQMKLTESEAARADLAKQIWALERGASLDPSWRPNNHSDELALERAVMRTETSAKRAEKSMQGATERHAAITGRSTATRTDPTV